MAVELAEAGDVFTAAALGDAGIVAIVAALGPPTGDWLAARFTCGLVVLRSGRARPYLSPDAWLTAGEVGSLFRRLFVVSVAMPLVLVGGMLYRSAAN